MKALRRRAVTLVPLGVLAAVLLIWGVAYGQLGGLIGFTEEQELELGRRASLEVEQKLTLLNDPHVTTFVEDLGRKLVAVSGRQSIPYTFRVVDGKEVNAFALPGGYVYVFRGLIAEADYESELAGVMAHEMGHVVARHGMEQLKRAQLLGLGAAIFGQILGGRSESGQGPSMAEMAIGLVGTGAYLSYSREAEAEADRIGVRMLYDAGYEPASFVTFLEKLEARQGRDPTGIGAFLSTHPTPAQRRANVGSIIASLPKRDDALKDTRRFQLIKQLLAGLAPPSQAPVPAPSRPGRLVRVASYKSPPGEFGLHSYADETGRQLTDGQYGTDEVDSDLGSGRGFEWVAWRQTGPRIIFDLGRSQPIQAIRIHLNRRSDRRIEPPRRVRIFFSADGRTITYSRVKTTDRIIFLDGRSRSIRIPTAGAEARYVAIEMSDGDPQGWIFVDEVLFESS
jgi:Zn-dependent protease with chaperone function